MTDRMLFASDCYVHKAAMFPGPEFSDGAFDHIVYDRHSLCGDSRFTDAQTFY